MKLTVRWLKDLAFEARTEKGLRFLLDAELEDGSPGLGPKPMEALLASLAGCTGMDVASILRKMRVSVEKFWMEIEAERAEEHPRVFTRIRLTYHFTGVPANSEEKIVKAVRLSQEKYCSVGAMLKQVADYSYAVVIDGKTVHTG